MIPRFHPFLACSAVVALSIGMLGCGGGADTTARLHALRIPPPPAAAPAASRLIVGVEPFSALAPLNDWRILKYESPTQLRYYEEDRWVAEPTTMVPELAAQLLERMGLARQASLLPWVEKMDYVLQGQLLSFEEFDAGSEHKARVAIELTLLRFPKREMVWNGTFRAEQSVTARTVPAAVEALSAATHEALGRGFEDMAKNLPAQP